ncbi:MAG: class 1 fructose-bisphosphatase [Chloroflexota bacterium]
MSQPSRTKTITLDRFLVERQRDFPNATGQFTRFMAQIGTVAKIIAGQMRHAALNNLTGATGEVNVQGESQKQLDLLGNQAFVEAFEYVDMVGIMVSEEMDKAESFDSDHSSLGYALMVDPVDGSSNIDVNGIIGSIFSVYDIDNAKRYSQEDALRRKGRDQVAAGYVMYGPSTMLVYTARDGVHSFVLNNEIGEFILHRTGIQMPERGYIFSANLGYYGKWEDSIRAYSDRFMAADTSYSLRYSGALLADFHQILHQGGVYFYPATSEYPQGKLRLLYECAPLALIAEQAGGIATDGAQPILDIQATEIHDRTPVIIGSQYEVNHYLKMVGKQT